MIKLNKVWAAMTAGLLLSPVAIAQAGWSWIQANGIPANNPQSIRPVYYAGADRILQMGGVCNLGSVLEFDVPSSTWTLLNWNGSCCGNGNMACLPTCCAGGLLRPWTCNTTSTNNNGQFVGTGFYQDRTSGTVGIVRPYRTSATAYCGGVDQHAMPIYSWDGAQHATFAQLSYPGTYPPVVGIESPMFHDATTDRVFLQQSYEGGPLHSWKSDGTGWATSLPFLVNPNVDSSLWYWDTQRRVLVYPKLSSSGVGLTIWEMDIDTEFWVERTVIPSSFQPRTGVAVGFHEDSGIAVFFGGRLDSDGSLRNDIWHYDGQSFYQASVGLSPAKRSGAKMCYHPPSQSLIMWGGENGAVLADTWRYRPASQTVAYQSFGAGCVGSTGTPTLVATPGSLPFAGQPFTVNVQNIPFFTSCFMGMGFSTTSYNGASLPLDLTVLNMPGCTLYTSLDWGVMPTTNVLGTAVWTFQIPPGVGGATFYNQAVVFDPLANTAGITVSNAAEATVGY